MGWVVNAMPQLLHHQKLAGTHCTGGWVGPKASQKGYEKSHTPLGFDPQNVEPVAHHYTNHTILAHTAH